MPARLRFLTVWGSPSRIFQHCVMCAKKIIGTDYYQDLDMLADPDDPRDLFGYGVMRAQKV